MIMYQFLKTNNIIDFRSIRKNSYQHYINTQYCQNFNILPVSINKLNQNSAYRKDKAAQLISAGICYNHKVVSIQQCQNQTVYDIVVPQTHNFGIITSYQDQKFIKSSGIFVHNCAQIAMPSNVCNLASINLVKFFNIQTLQFDFQAFKLYVRKAVRFLDNILDISAVPINSYKQLIKDKRRIGIGILGQGSLLYMLKLRFGSQQAIKFIDKL